MELAAHYGQPARADKLAAMEWTVSKRQVVRLLTAKLETFRADDVLRRKETFNLNAMAIA